MNVQQNAEESSLPDASINHSTQIEHQVSEKFQGAKSERGDYNSEKFFRLKLPLFEVFTEKSTKGF